MTSNLEILKEDLSLDKVYERVKEIERKTVIDLKNQLSDKKQDIVYLTAENDRLKMRTEKVEEGLAEAKYVIKINEKARK